MTCYTNGKTVYRVSYDDLNTVIAEYGGNTLLTLRRQEAYEFLKQCNFRKMDDGEIAKFLLTK